jgi:hypothetical protein
MGRFSSEGRTALAEAEAEAKHIRVPKSPQYFIVFAIVVLALASTAIFYGMHVFKEKMEEEGMMAIATVGQVSIVLLWVIFILTVIYEGRHDLMAAFR